MNVQPFVQPDSTPPTHRIIVIDGAVEDPLTYREAALRCTFEDIRVSEDVVFHGMAGIGHSPLADRLEREFGLTTTYEAFRLSPASQEEPNYVHCDLDMGSVSAILYLNPDPPNTDGTDFFRRKATGAIESTAQTDEEKLAEWAAWRDVSLWEPWHHVAAQFNRLLLFPSSYFHGRAIFKNWGEGKDGRLIQLVFGVGSLPCQ